MARPNVRFLINDESLVVPASEEFSSSIGAVHNPTVFLRILGTTAEKDAGYMFVPNLSDWYQRLNSYIIGLDGGAAASAGITFYTPGVCAASYLNGQYTGDGISAGFSGEWWPVHNFLQYGSACYVGFEATDGNRINDFAELGFDVIFQGGVCGGNDGYGTSLTTIVEGKAATDEPVIGIVYSGATTEAITSGNVDDAVTVPSGVGSYNYATVYGEKLHLDQLGAYTIKTPLAADVAGCIVRTDRDFYPWFSPAGSRRGRILNVLRLNRTLTTAEQDVLYDAGVNSVVTFPGDGAILYGDKTGETDTSTLSRINVSRLFMYIKRALGPVARSILFEQNDAITRSRFKIAAEGFLDRIVGQRGISEYRVICDSTNNTPEVVEANYFVADILIKPIPSINFVKITLTNKDLSDPIG